MNSSKMKNMIILKDLPSNMIDEAIIILKSNVKVREVVDKGLQDEGNISNFSDSSDIAIKEAESVVKKYIEKVENSSNINKQDNTCLNIKYRNLKFCAIVISIIGAISLVLNII